MRNNNNINQIAQVDLQQSNFLDHDIEQEPYTQEEDNQDVKIDQQLNVTTKYDTFQKPKNEFKKRQTHTDIQTNHTEQDQIVGKNVPLFIGTRLKNSLRYEGEIRQAIKQDFEREAQYYSFEDFLNWIDEPLQKLKETWHFQIAFQIYQKDGDRDKYYKKKLRKACKLLIENTIINSIIWSDKGKHKITLDHANVKKPSILKCLHKLLLGINDVSKLKGLFKKDTRNKKSKKNNMHNYIVEGNDSANNSNSCSFINNN